MNPRPANLVARILALAIDIFFIMVYALCLLGVSILVYQSFGGMPDAATSNIGLMQLLGISTLTLPAGVYFYLTESSKRHATFGKRIAKIKVVAANGGTLSRRQVALRTIIKLLPWEFAHTLVYQVVYYASVGQPVPIWVMAGLYVANLVPIIYLLTVILRRDRRGPHDLAAGTLVVGR